MPKPNEMVAQLPNALQPRVLAHPFKKICANCASFRANPEGGLGYCDNARVAADLGTQPPVRTSRSAENCRQFRKAG